MAFLLNFTVMQLLLLLSEEFKGLALMQNHDRPRACASHDLWRILAVG